MFTPRTTVDFERFLAGLAPEEFGRLSERLMSGAPARQQPIPRCTDRANLPLSFAQQRLWFLEQLTPGSAYNVPGALRLRGALSEAALEASLAAVVTRHEVLRTSFPSRGGTPVQQIAPPGPVALPVVDVSALGPAAERVARQIVRAVARRPFDVFRGPLLKAGLVRLGPTDHVLWLTLHHLIADGWSVAVLIRELAALYSARRAGKQAALPPLAVQYADYAAWQRQALSPSRLDEELAYWRMQLGGALPVLDLGDRRPSSPGPWRAGHVCVRVAPDVAAKLREAGRRHGATLFITLLAALQVVLHRYTGLTTVVIGTPVGGRSRSDLEGLIGCFVNTLVLRGEVQSAWTFAELLARTRESTLSAWSHQAVPFEQVVEAVQPERAVGRQPLFQVLFGLQNMPSERLALPELTVEPWQAPNADAKLELSLAATETANGLEIAAEYAEDVFERSTVEQVLRHWRQVLGAVAGNPRLRVGSAPLMDPAERAEVVALGQDPVQIGRAHV